METTCGGFAAAALTPYHWRGLTADRVVRLVVAAAAGDSADATVRRDDPRVEALVETIAGTAWRAMTADALCHRLLDALAAWHLRDALFDVELMWMLAEGA